MKQYVCVNRIEYPVISVNGLLRDEKWDERHAKTIHLEMTYDDAASIFVDGATWSIVNEWEDPETHEDKREEFDNSDFNVAGDITDHRDGTVSVKMGKQTDLEEAYELLYGGE